MRLSQQPQECHAWQNYRKEKSFSDIFDRNRRSQMSWTSVAMRYEKKMNVFSKGEMTISNATFPVRFSILICIVIVRPLNEAWTNFFVFCSFVSLFWFVLFCLLIQCVLMYRNFSYGLVEQKVIKGSCIKACPWMNWISMRPMMQLNQLNKRKYSF